MNIIYIVTEHAAYVGEEDSIKKINDEKSICVMKNTMQVKEVMSANGPVLLGTKLGELVLHCDVLASVILDKDSPIYKNYVKTFGMVKIVEPTLIKGEN